MNSKYLLITLIALFSLSIVYAVTGVQQTDIFYDSSTLEPVTGVQEILYTCSDLSCSSQGSLIYNLNTGNSNSLTFEYPYNPSSTASNPDYYSHFSFKECYLPKEYKEWVWGYGTSVQYDYHLNKAKDCHSPIDSFSITNSNYANEPVVINIKANLEADAYSAFTDLQLKWFPAGYEDYYSAETRVTLEIYNELDVLVYSDYSDLNILMDTSENIQFKWTPQEEGEYTARVTTDITDCQCSSSFVQYSEKIFAVWAERPQNECYTIINDLTATPQFAQEGDLVTITYNKISNYADSNYNKIAVQTKVEYIIIDSENVVVYSDYLTLDKNPNTINPKEISFQWTPDYGGDYTIKVTGVAYSSDCYCIGKTNPEDTAILGFYVEGVVEPYCGDGIINGNEECDDGNTNNYDGCSAQCLIEQITCSINSNCGQNGFIGNAYCKYGNVWKDFKQYACNNPGTYQSYCSSNVKSKLFQTCEFGCSNGECLPQPQECQINLDCGYPYYSEKYCQGNNVVKTLTTPVCINGICSVEIGGIIVVEECEFGCNNGQCLPEPPECIIDLDCGEPYYGDKYCQGDDVVKEHTIPKCIDGTCSSETEIEIVEECDSDEECKSGKCVKEDDDDDKKSMKFINLFSECVPIWECGGWTACYDQIKTRNCEDINYCENTIDKPIESVGCQEEITESLLEKKPVNWFWILIGVLILLILIVILIWLGFR
ncbi:MAG: myxococcus cysteine-rich repeat containing protein [archaeon]